VLKEESLSLPSACLGKWQRERQDEGGERERERDLLGKRRGFGCFIAACGFKGGVK
jgi:hypothetical protein